MTEPHFIDSGAPISTPALLKTTALGIRHLVLQYKMLTGALGLSELEVKAFKLEIEILKFPQ